MSLRVIDSHTGGEPTRLVVEGLPDLGGTVSQRLAALRDGHDWVRRSLCLEPRGSEVAVGAAMFPPSEPDCLADIVFFNNTGYIGMCGHGTIGVIASLAWLGRVQPGPYRLNTVAGVVTAVLHDQNTVSFENVRSFRHLAAVSIDVLDVGAVTGDVAYGGNWFFLVTSPQFDLGAGSLSRLMEATGAIMDALSANGVTGEKSAVIDHVEVFAGPSAGLADSRNFVLCPGKQYDRSPCGTGTSAKLACLAADGKLAEGAVWRQESYTGSQFLASYRAVEGGIVPKIEGQAFVIADTRCVIEPRDPFRFGIGPAG